MGDKQPRWRSTEAERLERWFVSSVESVDAMTRAAAARVESEGGLEGLARACDPRRLSYLREKLDAIAVRLRGWDAQLAGFDPDRKSVMDDV